MPDYTIVSPDGRELHLVGDKPPTREQVKGLFEHLKSQAKATDRNHDTPKAAPQRTLPQQTAKPPQKVPDKSAAAKKIFGDSPKGPLPYRDPNAAGTPNQAAQLIDAIIGMGGRAIQQHMPAAAGAGVGAPNPTLGVAQQHLPSEYSKALSRRPFMEQVHHQLPGGPLMNINPDVAQSLSAPSSNHGEALTKAVIRGGMGLATTENVAIGALLGPIAGAGKAGQAVRNMATGLFGAQAAVATKVGLDKYHASNGKDKDALADAIVNGAFTAFMAKHGLQEALRVRDAAMKSPDPAKTMAENLTKIDKPETIKSKPLVPPVHDRGPVHDTGPVKGNVPVPDMEPVPDTRPAASIRGGRAGTLPGERMAAAKAADQAAKPKVSVSAPLPPLVRPTDKETKKWDTKALPRVERHAQKPKVSTPTEVPVEPKKPTESNVAPKSTTPETKPEEVKTDDNTTKQVAKPATPETGTPERSKAGSAKEPIKAEGFLKFVGANKGEGVYTRAADLWKQYKKENPKATREEFGQLLQHIAESPDHELVTPSGNVRATDVFTFKDSTGKEVRATGVRPRSTFTVEPAKDTYVGKNYSGEKLYDRADGTRYRMRFDRKDKPSGYPDFGGNLAVEGEEGEGKPAEPAKVDKLSTPEPAPDDKFTGARNTITEKERAERNLSPVERQAYTTAGDSFLQGKEAVNDRGVDHHKLAEEVAKKPRVLSAEEVGTLAYGRHLLRQRYNNLAAEMDKAIEAKDANRIRELGPEILDTEAKFNTNDEALVRGGREQSAAFAARKQILYDNGSVTDMLAKGKRSAGRELKPLDKAKIERDVKEHVAAQAEIDRLTTENSKQAAELAVRDIADIAAADKAKRTGRIKDLLVERESLVKALKKSILPKSAQTFGLGQVGDVSIAFGRLMVNYIKGGIFKLDDVVAEVRKDFPDVTERFLHDSLSGYGRARKKATDLQNKITELKKEAKLTSQVEDEPEIDTRVPKEESETDNPRILSMRDELAQYQKQRRIQEEIADLDTRIQEGDIIAKRTNKAYPKSEDETRLAELKKEYADLQTSASIEEELQNKIELEKKGYETRQKPGEPRVQSEAEQNLRAELGEYRKQRDTKAAIEKLQAKLDAGEVEKKGIKKDRPRTQDTEKLAALKSEYAKRQADLTRLDNLRNQIEHEQKGVDTRAAKKPARTPLHGEEALIDERNKLRAKRDAEGKVEELTGKLNRSEIENRATAKNLPKTPEQTRLDELKAEYARRQAELTRVPDLETRLELEKAGKDTRSQKPLARVQPPEEQALRKGIALERQIRDVGKQADSMEAQLKQYEEKGILRHPKEKVPPTEVDHRLKDALARKVQAKARIESTIKGLEPKTALDRIVDYGRAAKLAGVGVFGKLAGASAWAMPVETLSNALSVIPGKLRVKGVPLYQIAEREGQFSLRSEMKGYRAFFSKEAVNNARDVFKEGFNQIHAEAQADTHGGNELSSYPGRLHGFVKSFLQTAEYNKAFDYRMNRLAEQYKRESKTLDLKDAEVIGKVGYGAALDAQMAILQGDNALTSGINNAITSIERAGSDRGKFTQDTAKLVASFLKTLTPIVKVSSNYAGKTIQMTGAGIPEGMIRHAIAHFDKEPITPKEADNIIRAYKHGGVGLVAAVIGLTQPAFMKSAGFFPAYRKGTKPNQDSKGNVMEPDEFEIMGMKIPHLFSHNPFLEAVQFWATVRRGIDTQSKLMGIGDEKFKSGIGEAGKGITSQIPGLESMSDMGAAMTGQGYDPSGTVGEYIRGMWEPQFINEAAKFTDRDAEGKTISRKSTGFLNKNKAGIPVLRKTLPRKDTSKGSSSKREGDPVSDMRRELRSLRPSLR